MINENIDVKRINEDLELIFLSCINGLIQKYNVCNHILLDISLDLFLRSMLRIHGDTELVEEKIISSLEENIACYLQEINSKENEQT